MSLDPRNYKNVLNKYTQNNKKTPLDLLNSNILINNNINKGLPLYQNF